MAKHSRHGGWSLYLRFGVASLLPVLALGWFLSGSLRDTIERRASSAYLENATTMFGLMQDTLLQPGDFERGFDDGRRALFDDLLRKAGPADTIAVRLVAPDGTVTYSTRAGETGQRLRLPPAARAALAGTAETRFTHGDADSIIPNSPQIELYLPVLFNGEVEGIVEAAGLNPLLLATIDSDVRRAQVGLGLGLAALWLALLPIMASVSRRLRRQSMENELLALHDTLTGLPNRNLLAQRLTDAVAGAERQRNLVGLLLIDLDRFKDVNDTLGHRMGDRLLRIVAKRLEAAVRPCDTVARLGGDEFAVLVADQVSFETIEEIAGRVSAAVRESYDLAGYEVTVEASIGVAIHPTVSEGPEQLLQHADIAMYAAKESGLDHLVYSADIDSHSPTRLALAAELRRALTTEQHQLSVHYQPAVDALSGRVEVMEALVRWSHPTRGAVAPVDFVPLAEESGLIRLLTAYVLDIAVERARGWQLAGMPVTLAVNLSARNLADRAVVDHIAACLRNHQLDPELLEVEVTETALLADPDFAVALLDEIRAMGVRVALDDFGTGFSSLNFLKRLSPDRVKIDKTFVDSVVNSRIDDEIVAALIDLSHSLEMSVTAEGVETGEQAAHLRRLGCDLLQGYLIARPMPEQQAAAFLSDRAGARATSIAEGAGFDDAAEAATTLPI